MFALSFMLIFGGIAGLVYVYLERRDMARIEREDRP